ncbi:MAG: InlB B-repeat-containing protein [Firmicutes bacterium]|nr:InlB B-repeat-containing protein [Bacillota bacterium]
MASKKKITTAVTAVTLAVALALGGTFAWQSISQTALNEASDVINPGGRLHDDFNGENKDVYVENFAEDSIYARVRLEEYFEIITNYGKEGIESSTNVLGSKNDDGTYNYELFTDYDNLNGDIVSAGNDTDGTSYWSWQTGGETVYMPTFNKNKDSLKADINGIYAEGHVGTISNRVLDLTADDAQYSAYKEYTAGEEKTAEATYDADSNSAEDDGVTEVEETHTAKATGNATLISMEDWLDMNNVSVTAADDPYGVAPAFAQNEMAILHYDKNAEDAEGTIADVQASYDSMLDLSDGTGFTREGYRIVGWNTAADGTGTPYALGEENYVLPQGETTLYAVWELDNDQQQEPQSQDGYWVYDTDGWVYWSQPIAPDTATGLLLDGIQLNQVMDDTWYYAINVVAQFVTADDVGKADGTGFYVEGTEPTAEAEALLKTIGVIIDDEAGEDGDGEGYTEALSDINFVYGEASATVYRGTSYTFGNVATGGFPVNPTAAEITTDGAASYVNDDLIIVIDENESNDSLSLAVTYSGDGGEPYTETVTLTVLDPAEPTDEVALQDAFETGGMINLGETEVYATEAEPITNIKADFLWTEGGTLNGGVINGTSSTADNDSDSYTTLFINNEKNWPEEGDEANYATINDTIINSESDFAVYIQTCDAGATLNGVTINGKFGGLLAEYNEDGQYCVNLNDVTITAGSNHKTDWVNTAVAAAHDAIINIYSGTYTAEKEGYAAYVFSSGGTINIFDGIFEGKLRNDAGANGNINIYGGTFDNDPTAYVDTENYKVVDNGNGTWTVQEIQRGLYTLYLKDSEGNYYDNDNLNDGFVSKVHQVAGSQITVEAGYTANPGWELPEDVAVAMAAYGLAADGWEASNSIVFNSVTAYTEGNNPYIFNAETGVLLNDSDEAVATINEDMTAITINKIVDNLIIDVYLIKDGQRIESTGSSSDVDKLFNSKYFVVSDSTGGGTELAEFGYIELWSDKTPYDSNPIDMTQPYDNRLTYENSAVYGAEWAYWNMRVYDVDGNVLPADDIVVEVFDDPTPVWTEVEALADYDTPTYAITMWSTYVGIKITYGEEEYEFSINVY